jgi:hypothetical protein
MRSKDGEEIGPNGKKTSIKISPCPFSKGGRFESYFLNKLIKNILQEHPETGEILEKYLGEDCLRRVFFKIKNPERACILFGVN